MTADLAGLFEAVWRKAYNQGVIDANRNVKRYLEELQNQGDYYEHREIVERLRKIVEFNELKIEAPTVKA